MRTAARPTPLPAAERVRVLNAIRRALRDAPPDRAVAGADRWADDAIELVEAHLEQVVAIARRCDTDCAAAAASLNRLVCGACDHRGRTGFCALRYLDCCAVHTCAMAIVGAVVGALRDEPQPPAQRPP
jgi:hypothetical protein